MATPRLAPALYPIALLACNAAPTSGAHSAPCPPSPLASPAAEQTPVRPHGAARPPPYALIQNAYGRKARSLNGAWRTIVDPYENGYYDYRRQPHTQDGYFANRKPSSKSALIEYDFDRSETLAVPGDWNSQRRELFFYEGTIWYKTDFDADLASDRRLFVYFGAANYDAIVYLNGKQVGEHVGGFTPFNIELTGEVRAKGNFLVVKVDNQRHLAAVPTVNTDWWNYGGLTRDVLLVDVPKTFIRDYSIQLAKGEPHRVSGWVQVDGPQASQEMTLRIPEAGIVVKARTDAKGFARLDTEATLELWSPERPKLYSVEIAGQSDRVEDRIGFRTLETRGTDILLNGRPVFLRGISMHEQAPLREGRAFSAEDARTLLGWARELGANFVRLAHYPHNEHIGRLADELGMMVWAELPVYWTIQWDNPETLENAKNQLAEMIARDKNRASVIIWSMGNETPPSAPRLGFMSELVRAARELDPSRLLSAALERREVDPHTQRIDDPLGALLDVLGCNEYLGWYDGLPTKADGMNWQTTYDKPLIMSEFGADALQGLHGDDLTRWSEEYQESVYVHQLQMLERIPFLRGMTPWILSDFRSPRRPLPGIQDYWNRKGLISDRGKKKLAFLVLQRFYERLARSAEANRVSE
jgi:beta-glucuronidase